jgi:glycosyltransferase involved in cell wall biosynthesis
MPEAPPATIVVPTRSRASYLDVALASIVPQAQAAGAEVLVVSDGPDLPTEAVTWRHRVRRLELAPESGLNAARNAGAAAGWLAALLAAAGEAPEYEVLGGPITPRLEGGGPRACGREPAPITSLDAGERDIDVRAVWGANMAIRPEALARVGRFDETIRGRGDEEEWLRRYTAAGGRIRYVAGAKLIHRRNAQDARLSRLSLAAYRLGRTARRNAVRKGAAPTGAEELRVLTGSLWHAVRRRCAYGIVFAAHAAGRLRELAAEGGG